MWQSEDSSACSQKKLEGREMRFDLLLSYFFFCCMFVFAFSSFCNVWKVEKNNWNLKAIYHLLSQTQLTQNNQALFYLKLYVLNHSLSLDRKMMMSKRKKNSSYSAQHKQCWNLWNYIRASHISYLFMLQKRWWWWCVWVWVCNREIGSERERFVVCIFESQVYRIRLPVPGKFAVR